MKRWNETRDVLERLAELRGEDKRAAIATVVRVLGSAYRREGARLLVAEDGSNVGNVSGGCLEEDVREVALRVIASGRSELRRYCSEADEVHAWDLGIGCDGQVDVLVAPAALDPQEVLSLLQGDAPFAVVSPADTAVAADHRLVVTEQQTLGGLGDAELDRAVAGLARGLLDDGEPAVYEVLGREIFVEPFRPPPRLVILGAGDDARPLAAIGASAGFQVVVADRRPAMLAPDRFPLRARLVLADAVSLADLVPFDENSYVVAMSHSYADDLACIRVVLRTAAAYVGILGPRQRTARMLDVLRAEAAIDESRVYGPVGLDLGAEGAEQVAVSVLAEVLAVHSGRRGGSLRDRRHPIHAVAAD